MNEVFVRITVHLRNNSMKRYELLQKNMVCIVLGCTHKARVHQMCLSHYQRIYYHAVKGNGFKGYIRNLVLEE